MVFKGKRIAFPFTVRQRKCAIMDCVGSDTQRHHIEYVTCFPLAMTVELCIAHHMEENAKQERLQQEYYFDWNRTVIITTS